MEPILTRETDYALRLLRSLSDQEWHTAGELAERELVPQAFAYKILKKLARGGFVEVVRGAEGGWRLMADLQQSSLYDLMVAMDGEYMVNACMAPDHDCPWKKGHGTCTIQCRLSKLQKTLEQELRSHSLASFFTPESEV